MEETRPREALETDLRFAGMMERKALEEAAHRPLEVSVLLRLIADELERATRHGVKFASLHEAYAVILEEMDEVWDICRQKRRDRNMFDLRRELIQLAAMAVKALISIDNFGGGSV